MTAYQLAPYDVFGGRHVFEQRVLSQTLERPDEKASRRRAIGDVPARLYRSLSTTSPATPEIRRDQTLDKSQIAHLRVLQNLSYNLTATAGASGTVSVGET